MSIFDLKTSSKELASSNDGISKMSYQQHAPTRDIVGANFPNGDIHYKWETSGTTWWVPSRSYFRIRCSLKRGNGTQLTNADNVAPNMGLASSLFQSAEFRINGKTVSRVSDFMPQVDALENRLNKSKSWLDGVGATTNFWQSDFKIRQTDVTSDGKVEGTSVSTERDALSYLPTTTVAIAVDTGVLTFGGGGTIPPGPDAWEVGDEIEVDFVGGKIRHRISSVGAATLQLSNIKSIATAAENVTFRRIRKEDGRNVDTFEITWTPPLSIFKVEHAIPSGSYEILLSPQPSSVFQKSAIESITVDKTVGDTSNDFKFDIVDMFMYTNTVEGPRMDTGTYLLDLEETNCQSEKIDNFSFAQKNWDVSPSTYALTVAYQDLRAGTNTQISASKFKSYNVDITTSEEQKLNRWYINYAGTSYPSPDADPSFVAGKDYTTQRYMETLLYSGSYYDVGGAESLKEWHDRGSYYHTTIPRDGTDRSTRVSVHQQFENTIDSTNLRVLLFSHYRQTAIITMSNGRVTDVRVEMG